MNPTFNLSAAWAAPKLPASRSAAAAARIVFLMIDLQTFGVDLYQLRTWRPHRASPKKGVLTVGHKNGTERGRCGGAAGAGARQQHQHDHGREIRQRRHELRGDADARALRMQ